MFFELNVYFDELYITLVPLGNPWIQLLLAVLYIRRKTRLPKSERQIGIILCYLYLIVTIMHKQPTYGTLCAYGTLGMHCKETL